ncbi:hypothetical protein M153_7300011131, partial [Pseudoloma neurophilia]
LGYFSEAHSEPSGGDGIVIHFDKTIITHRHKILGRNTRSHIVLVVGAVDIYSKKMLSSIQAIWIKKRFV